MRRGSALWFILANSVEIFGCLLLIILCVDIFAGVISRSLVGQALPWSEELARYLFVWVSLLGAAIGVKRRGHFSFTLVVMSLPAGWRKPIAILGDILIVLFGALLVREGLNLVSRTMTQYSAAMNVPIALLYFSVPFSGALMVIYVAPALVGHVRALTKAGQGKAPA